MSDTPQDVSIESDKARHQRIPIGVQRAMAIFAMLIVIVGLFIPREASIVFRFLMILLLIALSAPLAWALAPLPGSPKRTD